MHNPELVLSISGTIVAACALLLAVYEGHKSRLHDRISVRPLLTFRHEKYPKSRSLIALNTGLGPAILNRVRIFVRGELIQEGQEGGWPAALRSAGITSGFAKYFFLVGSDVLTPGSKRVILQVDCEDYSQDDLEKLDRAMKTISVRLDYSSMYQERFHEQSKSV